MANQDDGFLREVEEELRRERLEKIWRQYGNYIIAAAVLIVVGVAGFKYYESSRLSAAQATGARYQEAIALAEDGKEGSAAKEFETIASEGGKGYRALARLQLAGTLLKEGKRDEAFKTFEVLADDSSADDMLRQYAALQAASLRLGKADFTEMQNRLNPLIGDESPWRYSARTRQWRLSAAGPTAWAFACRSRRKPYFSATARRTWMTRPSIRGETTCLPRGSHGCTTCRRTPSSTTRAPPRTGKSFKP